ncbi:metallophosphoesterase [Gloeocapsopsis crepidinum]|uniref:metallophosphoesterase n=1 Tax=Gloeocapsopsis crepidinum TaxID=693223 RepID=UPI003898EC50
MLISGDFIDKPGENQTQEIDKVIELVSPLPKAGIPTYAVLGNHDYRLAMGGKNQQLAAQLHQGLEAAGVQVLKNEAVSLTLPDQQRSPAKTEENLYLVGIGPHLPNEDKPIVAISQVPEKAPRLVMMHNPDSFAALLPQTAPLAVAGHTHGGQIRLLFTPEWSWLALTSKDEVTVDGWISGKSALCKSWYWF